MSYIIRDETGVMIAKVSNTVANKIIECSQGQFRPYTVPGKSTVTIFELAEDLTFGLDGFQLYLWKSTKMIPTS